MWVWGVGRGAAPRQPYWGIVLVGLIVSHRAYSAVLNRSSVRFNFRIGAVGANDNNKKRRSGEWKILWAYPTFKKEPKQTKKTKTKSQRSMNRSKLSLITLVNGQMPHGLYHLQYVSCRRKLVPRDSKTAVWVCLCVCVSLSTAPIMTGTEAPTKTGIA